MEQTPKIVLIGTAIYFFIGVMICDSLKNTRDGEEQGSSRWATIQEINRKYAAKEIVFPGVPKEMQNMILTSQARLGFDFHRHGKTEIQLSLEVPVRGSQEDILYLISCR